MFNRLCVLLVGLLWQVPPISAQPKYAGQKITYLREVPKNVARSIPRKAKRLFWGTFTPQKGAPLIGLHWYVSNSTQILELWQKKAKRFERINRIPGIHKGPSYASAKFNAEFYWLDSAQKTTPVLVVTRITYGDDNLLPGEYRQIKVLALRTGWKSKPSIQTFYDGSSNAGEDGFSAGYNDKGQLELSTYSGDFSGSVTETYAWDGKQFSSVPEKRTTESR
ncbi:hypothetical protein EON80_29275 [bacterium]|nr:MAG: hypothetical protein EON80_29275 [bacterium]